MVNTCPSKYLAGITPARCRGLPSNLRAPLRTEPLRPDRPALRSAELPPRDPLRVLAGRLAQRLGVLALGDRGHDVHDGLRPLVRVTGELPLDRGHEPQPRIGSNTSIHAV